MLDVYIWEWARVDSIVDHWFVNFDCRSSLYSSRSFSINLSRLLFRVPKLILRLLAGGLNYFSTSLE